MNDAFIVGRPMLPRRLIRAASRRCRPPTDRFGRGMGIAAVDDTSASPTDPAAVPMFLFFSNRLGCLGSILVSAAATLLLLWLFGWL
jgi:hypothetical protein